MQFGNCDFEAGDTQRGFERQPVGNDVDSSIGHVLRNAAGGGECDVAE